MIINHPATPTAKASSLSLVRLLVATVLALSVLAGVASPSKAAPKFSAIAVDARNGKILFARNADALRYPASMTKMMTLYLVFEDLRAGRIKLTTRLRVSRYAASRPPSKLGFKPGKTIMVKDAIRALVTKSANDVATAVAENLGGTEANFARRMTRKARALGMTRTTFRNASGLPNRSHMSTARDMATLGLRLQRDFPRYFKVFKTRRFVFRGRRYGNHNRLLGRIKGVDGIKTGYTRASGFNLTTSAQRGRKRIVAVVMGGRTGRSRNRYMSALIARMFKTKHLVSSSRIALVAGTPPGYVAAKRTRLAQASRRSKNSAPAPTLPRQKPTTPQKTPKIIAARKSQDRIAKERVVLRSTFKTAQIVDQDAPDDLVPDHHGTDPSTLKADLKKAKPTRPIAVTKTVSRREKQMKTASREVAKNPHEDSWNIQIGAFPSKESAKGRLVKAKAKARRNLHGKPAFTIEVNKDGRRFYRARFAGFNRKSARRACRALARRGVSCFALAPRG